MMAVPENAIAPRTASSRPDQTVRDAAASPGSAAMVGEDIAWDSTEHAMAVLAAGFAPFFIAAHAPEPPARPHHRRLRVAGAAAGATALRGVRDDQRLADDLERAAAARGLPRHAEPRLLPRQMRRLAAGGGDGAAGVDRSGGTRRGRCDVSGIGLAMFVIALLAI